MKDVFGADKESSAVESELGLGTTVDIQLSPNSVRWDELLRREGPLPACAV